MGPAHRRLAAALAVAIVTGACRPPPAARYFHLEIGRTTLGVLSHGPVAGLCAAAVFTRAPLWFWSHSEKYGHRELRADLVWSLEIVDAPGVAADEVAVALACGDERRVLQAVPCEREGDDVLVLVDGAQARDWACRGTVDDPCTLHVGFTPPGAQQSVALAEPVSIEHPDCPDFTPPWPRSTWPR